MIKIETVTYANLSKAIPGERFTFKGQGYTVESLDRYENDAGRECCAVTVSTFCAKCGCLFEHTTRRPRKRCKFAYLHNPFPARRRDANHNTRNSALGD